MADRARSAVWTGRVGECALLMVLLQACDGLATSCLVFLCPGSELNPLMASVVGEWWFFLVKVCVVSLSMLGLWLYARDRPGVQRLAYRGLVIMTAFYGVVVGWNLVMLGMVFGCM